MLLEKIEILNNKWADRWCHIQGGLWVQTQRILYLWENSVPTRKLIDFGSNDKLVTPPSKEVLRKNDKICTPLNVFGENTLSGFRQQTPEWSSIKITHSVDGKHISDPVITISFTENYLIKHCKHSSIQLKLKYIYLTRIKYNSKKMWPSYVLCNRLKISGLSLEIGV